MNGSGLMKGLHYVKKCCIRDRSFFTREGGLVEIGGGSSEKVSEKGWSYKNIKKARVGHAKN